MIALCPLATLTSGSKPVYLVGNILPVADSPNLFVQTQGVVGEEDDTGIPVTIRYELSDSSETVEIKLDCAFIACISLISYDI